MNRRTLFWIACGVVLLHGLLFFLLANKGIPKRPGTPQEPDAFRTMAVRVRDTEGNPSIVRQFTVSTQLADPTPQFANEP